MSLLLIDHLSGAYHSFRRNRTRSVLTTMGIAIGVASVTCILALSGGVRDTVRQQISPREDLMIIARPAIRSNDPNTVASPLAQQAFSTSTLTEEDVKQVASINGVESVVPLMTITGTLKSNYTTVANNVVLATSPDFVKTTDVTMRLGQFLDEVTDNDTAVIGEQLAIDLFGTDRPIGSTFQMRGQSFTVIGIIKKSSNPINYNNVDLNHAVVVSFERGKLFHQGRSQIQQLNIIAKPGVDIRKLTQDIQQKLIDSHLGEQDFTLAAGRQISQPTNELFKAMSDVMAAIAAISLIVGGIGIMNIMLVGVAERTREIGIRKAVGASNGNIIAQFLLESLLLSLVGAVIGYLLGYLAAFVLSTFLYFAPSINWQTALVAFVMALIVGILFGLYPALKAARKDTIESLRQSH